MSKQAGHPRLAIPEIPLIGLLCALAGSVDAAAYLLCGQIFVANMTGNTVLLGISLLQRNPKEAALRAGMVAAFLAGVIVARLLAGTADLLSCPGNPKGCLMVQGALACGHEADPIRKELISRRAMGEAALSERFERAKLEGDLPSEADPGDLARYVMAVMHGMSVQSAGGANRAALQGVIAVSLRAWPQ